MKYESFSYTPIELAESMTSTVHDTLNYLVRNEYISVADYEHLTSTLAVYAMPNRKGFGKKLLERFFGENENDSAFIFPIIEVDPVYAYKNERNKKGKPTLNVVKGEFNKDTVDE